MYNILDEALRFVRSFNAQLRKEMGLVMCIELIYPYVCISGMCSVCVQALLVFLLLQVARMVLPPWLLQGLMDSFICICFKGGQRARNPFSMMRFSGQHQVSSMVSS